MRLALVLAAPLILVACGDGGGEPAAQAKGDPVECAIAGEQDFAPVCLYEYDAEQGLITVHHPDGGFRRLKVLPGGAGVVAADGADEVIQGLAGGLLEVTVGPDRYRLPTKPVP